MAIPAIGSLYLRHNLTGQIKSLSEFPPQDIPPVAPLFFAFRVMVGLGLLMIAVSLTALTQRLRGRLWQSRWLLKSIVLMGPAGFIALLAGWVVTEVGRQPRRSMACCALPTAFLPLFPAGYRVRLRHSAYLRYGVLYRAALSVALRQP